MPKAVPRVIKSFGDRTSHLDSAEEVRNRGALYVEKGAFADQQWALLMRLLEKAQ